MMVMQLKGEMDRPLRAHPERNGFATIPVLAASIALNLSCAADPPRPGETIREIAPRFSISYGNVDYRAPFAEEAGGKTITETIGPVTRTYMSGKHIVKEGALIWSSESTEPGNPRAASYRISKIGTSGIEIQFESSDFAPRLTRLRSAPWRVLYGQVSSSLEYFMRQEKENAPGPDIYVKPEPAGRDTAFVTVYYSH